MALFLLSKAVERELRKRERERENERRRGRERERVRETGGSIRPLAPT